MGMGSCSQCEGVFPEEKLLLTGDGALCPACELSDTDDVDTFERKMHRKSATGALGLACLSVVSLFVLPYGLLFTVPGFAALAKSAFKGGREHGDVVTLGITGLAGVVVGLVVLMVAVL